MKVHVLQHVRFEGLGSIEPWLAEREAVTHTTRFFDSPDLPELGNLELVIAMSGQMSVNEEAELPWLKEEKRFVADAISAGKAVLGREVDGIPASFRSDASPLTGTSFLPLSLFNRTNA